jgi:hypothetical protein
MMGEISLIFSPTGGTMNTRSTILSRIEAFMADHDMTEREFGLRAVNDNKFIPRLRRGYGVTLRSIERAEAFMSRACATEAAQ